MKRLLFAFLLVLVLTFPVGAANDLAGNPWVVDTAATITTSPVYVVAIRWVGGTTAGHTAVIQDGAGTRTQWIGTVAAANEQIETVFSQPFPLQGIKVSTLASGILYIYLR